MFFQKKLLGKLPVLMYLSMKFCKEYFRMIRLISFMYPNFVFWMLLRYSNRRAVKTCLGRRLVSMLQSFPKKYNFLFSISDCIGWIPSILSHIADLVGLLKCCTSFTMKCCNRFKIDQSFVLRLFHASQPNNTDDKTTFCRY